MTADEPEPADTADVDESPERAVHASVTVDAPVASVWDAWTTEEGVRSFFAPDCSVELEPFGDYEILFAPDADPGERGAEGNVVLAFERRSMFSFTWNAPPSLPSIRNQRTSVVVRFTDLGDGTRVDLTHTGWGDGEEWDEAVEYLSAAWSDAVLPNLRERFREGPIEW